MELLDLTRLKTLQPGTMFASGISNVPPLHYELIKWVAVRGDGTHDWAIYYHQADFEYETIALMGEKVKGEEVIKRLVPCDEEAFKMYQY